LKKKSAEKVGSGTEIHNRGREVVKVLTGRARIGRRRRERERRWLDRYEVPHAEGQEKIMIKRLMNNILGDK
jgi:hypothetical protein